MCIRDRPHFHPDLPSMRCVGYRQVWEVLQWQQTLPGSALQPATAGAAGTQISEQTNNTNIAKNGKMFRHIRETGIAATRQLAKRQLTWLRSMPERVVEACDAPGLAERVEARVRPVWG